MGILSKQQILASSDLSRRLVPCPEWGGDVYVYAVSGGEIAAFEKAISGRDHQDYLAGLIALTVRDENGNRLFGDGDVPALAGKAARPLYRLFGVAQRLNGLRAKDFEDLEKNLPSGPDTGTPSESPMSPAAPFPMSSR